MPANPVTSGLKALLADSYTLYLKTQNYHWNVTGPQFSALHALFMAQYSELALAIDEIAERIRALGEKAPGSYREFSQLATIKEATGKENTPQMVKTLRDDHKTLIQSLYSLLEKAQKKGDEGTCDLLTTRIPAHEKQAWMLDSSL